MCLRVTVEVPRDEAAGAVGHVEGPGGVGEAVGGEHADHGGDAALQRELDLRLVCVPRRKRYGDDVPRQQIRAPARHLTMCVITLHYAAATAVAAATIVVVIIVIIIKSNVAQI